MRKRHLSFSPYGTASRRRFSPLMLVGAGVALTLILAVAATVIVSHLTSSHAAGATPNMNCTLIVPANPLSAQGLATPYQLVATNPADGPCNEANANQSAFVQGVIFDPRADTFSVYSPLIIDQGTQPAVQPTVPTLPRGAVVGLWFGFNGNNLTQQGATRNALRQGRCVNGLPGSVFGQFSYCNAPAFFSAANRAIRAGRMQVPALGTAKDGQTCPTTRDFSVVDQDQSDNVQTQYLATANGQIAQFSAANQGQLQNATVIANPSDNALLTNFIDPALGCQPWTAPNLADNGAMVPAFPLDELQAAADQKAPIALLPLTDPMTLNNGNQSLFKTNLYRLGADQTPAWSTQQASGTTYCLNLVKTGLPRIQLDQTLTVNGTSPAPTMANSLFTFLAMRFNQSFTNLNCGALINIANPVTLQTDGNGVVIGATFANGTTTTGGNTGAGGVQQIVTGTATITLDTNAGNAQMALNIAYPNHPNQQIDVNIATGSCTNAPFFTQIENTDGQGNNTANVVINNLQGLQALPANWFFTVTDPTQAAKPIVGCGSVVANGTMGTATLGTVAANNGGTTPQATPTATQAAATPTTGTSTTPTTTPAASPTVAPTVSPTAPPTNTPTP